jgi:glycosidase
MKISCNEFHVSRKVRELCDFDKAMYASTGNVILADMKNVRAFAEKLNALFDKRNEHEKRISAGQLNALGLIDEIFHYVCMLYRKDKAAAAFSGALDALDETYGKENINKLLLAFMAYFPPTAVYQGSVSAEEYLNGTAFDTGTKKTRTNREQTLEELILLHLANENPAFRKFSVLFNDSELSHDPIYEKSWADIQKFFKTLPAYGPFNHDLISLLREPVVFSPESLKGQLDYIRLHWSTMLGEWLKRLLAGIDTISEEEKAAWQPMTGGGPDMVPYSYENLMKEYERFSTDSDWMPKVVLIAKTILVWLDQLSKKYKQEIRRLDQIPDEELDTLRDEGFTGVWLIGIWERSHASRRIKQICGNPEAAASAYSLYDYEIAENIGGWNALEKLRTKLWQRGIRLASDMVPNHTGMDAKWIVEKPDLFVQRRDCPFPQYSFNGENLSLDSRVSVYIEDHYYNKTDCAIVFKRIDNQTGDVRYIYHGNDGTGMPWNDTAQIDFLNPDAREEVIQEIIKVARNFPIIRFDAAMVLAKKHIRRLWYPEPGHGGDIATRSETGLSSKQFNDAIPNEFWREVVDRIAKEVPDTLLLAEAFWMMEGYFVRTLGMHRVYNSAFMNMLKKEENEKYRNTVKNTIKFDPQVLKRFVNFMNNPDEETAVAQFGKGDKYFGVCTLLITMPGLPMFGHGQIEGFEEKYGMEYTKAYRDELPDQELIARHRHEIFPLMKKRYLFAQVENFLFYDVWDNGQINENIFAYSNTAGSESTVVFYNNKYERAAGWIKQSCEYAVKTGSSENDIQLRTRSIAEGLNLTSEDDKYCIFREQHSGLWFIRSSSDICEHGMYISLNAFEAQVYMDIHQAADTPDHRWKILCETLAGRGCEDLEIEWEEVKYRGLYKALEIFMLGILPDIDAVLHPVQPGKSGKTVSGQVKRLLKNAEPAAIAFYTTAAGFAKDDNIKLETPKKQFSEFCSIFTRIAELYTGRKNAKVPDKEYGSLYKAKNADSFLSIIMNSGKNEALMLSCYASVSSLAAKGCAKKYSLARKFTEYAKGIGISDTTICNPLSRMFALAPAASVTSFKNIKNIAYKTALILVEKEDSQLLTGNNVFNGIQWFNKELSDSSLAYFTALMLLQTKSAQEADVLRLYLLLADAKLKASYKCKQFVKLFAPEKSIKAETSSKRRKALKIVSAGSSDGKSKEKTMTPTTEKKPAAVKTTAKPDKKKVVSKKTVEKKPATKKTTVKAVAKKTAAKPAGKKPIAKKAAAKKTAAEPAGKKPIAKKAAAKKPVAKPVVKKPAAKPAVKKAAVKKATPKTAAKKTAAKKAPSKKTPTKK